LADIFELF